MQEEFCALPQTGFIRMAPDRAVLCPFSLAIKELSFYRPDRISALRA
jgi:hypothetical protein